MRAISALLVLVAATTAQDPAPRPAEPVDAVLHLVEVLCDHHVDSPSPGGLVRVGLGALKGKPRLPAADANPRALRAAVERAFAGHGAGARQAVAPFAHAVLAAVPGRAHRLPAHDYRARAQLRKNRYVGVGVVLSWDEEADLPLIDHVFPRGPGKKAGLRDGDIVTALDGEDPTGWGLPKFIERSRGEEGTEVTYTVRHPGDEEVRRIAVVRGVVPRDTLGGLTKRDDGTWRYRADREVPLAYVAIREINAATPHELRRLEAELRRRKLSALVLDLRNAQAEVDRYGAMIADLFLERGSLGHVERRGGPRRFRASPDVAFAGWPVVLLVGPRTLGAAEWMAAALVRNGRAVAVGRSTGGQPFVRGLVPLPRFGGGLLVPTGRLVPVGKELPLRPSPDHLVQEDEDHAVTGTESLEIAVRIVREALERSGG